LATLPTSASWLDYGRALARSKLAEHAAAADDLRQAMRLDRSLEHTQADGRAELAQILPFVKVRLRSADIRSRFE
jgi:hypothetical protein